MVENYFFIFLGMMVENIKGNGKMENNMGMENFIIPRNKYGRKVFGAKEKELDGQMKIWARINSVFFFELIFY